MLKSLSISLVLVFIFTSCVFDDLSNCQRTNISFFYSADGDENVIENYIQNATLFIYDKNDQLVSSDPVDLMNLHFREEMPLSVEPGEYTLVAWGNLGNVSKITNENDLHTGILSHPDFKNKKIKSNDSLYFASEKITVLGNNVPTTHPIRFKSAHINLQITARGFTLSEENVVPNLFISGLMPQYDFEMIAGEKPETTYTPVMIAKPAGDKFDYVAHTKVLRFAEDAPIEIDLEDPITKESLLLNKITLAMVIEQAIKENKAIDFNKNELLIPILIQYINDGVLRPYVTIEISEWEPIQIIPGK